MTEDQLRDIALVVDNSPETLSLLTDALDKAGMTVMVALDGASAIKIAQRLLPDVILLDALMPGIDGFETCRRLKTDPALRKVPVIFMTGLSETEHIVKGLEAGGIDYVTKPVVTEEMLARIRVHLATARAAHSARAALDASGRHLLAVNAAGDVLWLTPQAEKTFLIAEGDKALKLPAEIRDWVAACNAGDANRSRNAPTLSLIAAGPARISYVGRIGPDEFLLRLAPQEVVELPSALFGSFRLTARELEVLSWIVRGKSNRDAAEILGMSARTVDKHLEHVYAKLGVENRTSATALVLNLLGKTRG